MWQTGGLEFLLLGKVGAQMNWGFLSTESVAFLPMVKVLVEGGKQELSARHYYMYRYRKRPKEVIFDYHLSGGSLWPD